MRRWRETEDLPRQHEMWVRPVDEEVSIRLDQGAPGVREADFLEPQVVGVDASKAPCAQEQHDEQDRDTDQPAANPN